MTTLKCTCKYVPDYILENLAKNNVEVARASIHQSMRSREEREAKVVPIEGLVGGPEGGEEAFGAPPRKVYDCQFKWQKRVELARSEGDPATGDNEERDAYESAGKVRDYFGEVLNRNSLDNAGMGLILNVHFGEKYMNAFWDGDEMTFGDGDGEIFISFARSLDVVAHELTHGITQHTANLVYKDQSGALNEHFSDVFGTAITQYVLGQTAHEADWLVGDEIMGPALYGEALRSMKAPGTAYDNALIGKDPQPDHMNNYYAGPADNGGVHINSGIPNKAFYLVAMTIGTAKAALIWYHALQSLWPKAQFNDAVAVIANSARILTKDGLVPQGSTQTVRAAFKAVGLPV